MFLSHFRGKNENNGQSLDTEAYFKAHYFSRFSLIDFFVRLNQPRSSLDPQQFQEVTLRVLKLSRAFYPSSSD
jgi:hypothetical protein